MPTWQGEALVRRHEREKKLAERKERFLARIEQREAMAMERKLAKLEREDRGMVPENSGTDHVLGHRLSEWRDRVLMAAESALSGTV